MQCGQAQKKLGQEEREFVHATAAAFLTPLKNFLEGDMKTLQVSFVVSPVIVPSKAKFLQIFIRVLSRTDIYEMLSVCLSAPVVCRVVRKLSLPTV